MHQIGATVPLALQAAHDVPGKAPNCCCVLPSHAHAQMHATVGTCMTNLNRVDIVTTGIRPEGPDSNDLDVQAAEAGAPATFFCPISFRCFRDPVLLPTGQT